jgi:hypothetical protein
MDALHALIVAGVVVLILVLLVFALAPFMLSSQISRDEERKEAYRSKSQ